MYVLALQFVVGVTVRKAESFTPGESCRVGLLNEDVWQ
jgi:hypothetical protein